MALPTTMKEAHVDTETNVTIHDVPLPKITKPTEILVKVMVTGCNPKDWKQPAGILKVIKSLPNSGDDVTGVVAAVGEKVQQFKLGDRVAGLHELGVEYGSFAEYSILQEHTTFHLSDNVSFEDAATMPMVALMASIGLFGMLQVIPGPWVSIQEPTPLLIYGAAGSVGSMAIKLASIANIHPIIGIAGHGIPFVEELIDKDKGDVVIDYRKGSDAVVEGVKKALNGRKLKYAFDAVSEHDSFANTAQVLCPDDGRVTFVLPQKRDEFGSNVQQSNTMAPVLFRRLVSLSGKDIGDLGGGLDGPHFGLAHTRVIAQLLDEGLLKPHPYHALRGFSNIQTALKDLRSGKNHAEKYVVRLRDTPDGEVLL